MSVMDEEKVYVQRQWTDEELTADGFLSYRPVKRITMMRLLSSKKATRVEGDADKKTVSPPSTYWIAYRVGDAVKSNADDFDPRMIEPLVFAKTFRHWDDTDWRPTRNEAHLERLGCVPYYRIASIWAKHLTSDTQVQGKEGAAPTLAPAGTWLCVSMDGEPRNVTESWFHENYVLPKHKTPVSD